MSIKNRFRTSLAVPLFFLASISVTRAQYSGGSGTAEDPYEIATAADLIALGETPAHYDKHFILTADIDLDPNLPGRKVFDNAVIAPDTDDTEYWFQGTRFEGVFDGNGHTISHLTIIGESYVGLFGMLASEAMISDLGLEAIDITGVTDWANSDSIGGLAGESAGTITFCYSTGAVTGDWRVGGLVGNTWGGISMSHSTASVNGYMHVGGLTGQNEGTVTRCHGSSTVCADYIGGGLIGWNNGTITQCYSSGTVDGGCDCGGLVGWNGWGTVAYSYSLAAVTGDCDLGGLIGYMGFMDTWPDSADRSVLLGCYSAGTVAGEGGCGGLVGVSDDFGVLASCSFWDVQSSGQSTSAEGIGRSTAQMRAAATYLETGWDFVGERENGPNDVWKIVEGQTYPLLSWQKYGGGTGEPNDPYLIYTAEHLNALGAEPNDYDKHFKLMADIDLSGYSYDRAVIAPDMNDIDSGFQGTPFAGVFDGDGHAISHLTISGGGSLGLFGKTGNGAIISNVDMEGVDVNATGNDVGGLAGWNSGRITSCYSTGHTIAGSTDIYVGGWSIGGLVGDNDGTISNCYSTGAVSGQNHIGGLVGFNYDGVITSSYSTGSVTGLFPTNVNDNAGGLVGENYWGTISNCYSNSSVRGNLSAGGLVGENGGTISNCYSNGLVSVHDQLEPGGLVGIGGGGVNSFWDIETSGQSTSTGGMGKTTAEMQTASTFLEAGWDFIDETENGTDDIWWILEGQDYPRLWWELVP